MWIVGTYVIDIDYVSHALKGVHTAPFRNFRIKCRCLSPQGTINQWFSKLIGFVRLPLSIIMSLIDLEEVRFGA